MNWHSYLAASVLAEVTMPLAVQIICIVLTALFLLAFSIAREPRGWRRLFQSMFATSEGFSVNRNKLIDENLKRYGIVIAMVILVADVGIFVWGITARDRERQRNMSAEELIKLNEINRLKSGQGADGARRAAGNN